MTILFRKLQFGRIPILAVIYLLPIVALAAQAGRGATPLSAEQRKLLDGLIDEFLFDPTGAQRVRVKTTIRTVWASSAPITREGWLVPGEGDRPTKVYFTDGDSIPAPAEKELEKLDFLAACRARFAEKGGTGKEEPDQATFLRMRRTAVGYVEEPDLVLAAWLYRLGHKELADRALAKARESAKGDEKKMVADLRKRLAWSAFAAMVHAYMVRADEEAIVAGERLLRLYPEEAKHYGQARAIVASLKRRKAGGTFGKTPEEEWPKGFDTWDEEKRIAYLIESLDEVDARQQGQPGGIELASDRRVWALIDIGDAAVPALIDTIESDDRLTRSVHFWRDFAASRTVLGVREPALAAAMSILRVRVFEPGATGDNFTGRGKTEAKGVAAKLRDYWDRYGSLPFDERMMKVLIDPALSHEAQREAAYNLASLGEDRTIGTTVWTGQVRSRPKVPNPAVAKFKEPTVAEAVLAAMDRDLAAHDAKKRTSIHDYLRREIEDKYFLPLIRLDDKRITLELVRRCKAAKTVRMRRKWAYASHWLGQSAPLKAFALDVQAGKIDLPPNNQPNTNEDEQPGNVELRGIVEYLTRVDIAECNNAIGALADPKHPFYEMTAKRVLGARMWDDEAVWCSHPICLKILRKELDNTTATGRTYGIEGNSLKMFRDGSWAGSSPIPEMLADPKKRRLRAPERKCDIAAERLHELVFGFPEYHVLFRDAGERLKTLKESFDRFEGSYRRANWLEKQALGLWASDILYLPDIPPLGRPATLKDVEASKAVFHLDGKGKLTDLKLPAVAELKRRRTKKREVLVFQDLVGDARKVIQEEEEDPPKVLIIQAEVGPDGKVVYGTIGKGGICTRKAHELTGIAPLKKPDPKAEDQ